MKLFTIGFTKKSAETFFTRLKKSGATRLVDVRLHNVSQLAGFAKKDDLSYFAREICGMSYLHMTELAPTEPLMDSYKRKGGAWSDFAPKFNALMAERRIEEIDRKTLDGGCLLCSEDKPHHCHRTLVADYLKEKWGDVEIVHL
jgi:uncharacterized protein (DUF488 family)